MCMCRQLLLSLLPPDEVHRCSCRRLGLTPLCYLWQRDQEELLSEMIEAGMEAVLIKVAGIGLTTKHLGKTLAQMQPTLLKLVKSFLVCWKALR